MSLLDAIQKIKPCTVLVAGDLLLDTYTDGEVKRISPEAPVPVVHVKSKSSRPGGAGNVVLNLLSLGAKVHLLSRVGADFAGEELREQFEEEGVNLTPLITQRGYMTPIKNRIIAGSQQLLRIDHEVNESITSQIEDEVIDKISQALDGVEIVAISDYGKGFLTPKVLQTLIQEAKKRGILTITDPKGVNFAPYYGTDLIKPNLAEAYMAAQLTPDHSIEEAAYRILEKVNATTLMVTRSKDGISLFQRDGVREDFPALVKEINDVTGAGDTVLAMLTVALGNQLSLATGAILSNVAASIAVEHFGCARVTLVQVEERLRTEDDLKKAAV